MASVAPTPPSTPDTLIHSETPGKVPEVAESTATGLKLKEDPDRRGVVWAVVFASMVTGLALGDYGLAWTTLLLAAILASCWSAVT